MSINARPRDVYRFVLPAGICPLSRVPGARSSDCYEKNAWNEYYRWLHGRELYGVCYRLLSTWQRCLSRNAYVPVACPWLGKIVLFYAQEIGYFHAAGMSRFWHMGNCLGIQVGWVI